MRKTLVTLALAGTLSVTGAALLVPGSAFAQTKDGTPRLTALKDALSDLVDNGTLTQTQADKVATTLDSALPGPGRGGGPDGGGAGHGSGHGPGHGPVGAGHLGPEELAEAIGITTDELHTQREAGKTLAQIAATKGISNDALISRLVSAAKARLAKAVTNGRITQAQSNTVSAKLTDKITEMVDRVGPRGPGRDKDGKDGKDGADSNTSATPSASPTASAKSS